MRLRTTLVGARAFVLRDVLTPAPHLPGGKFRYFEKKRSALSLRVWVLLIEILDF